MPTISPDKPYRIGRSRTGLGLFATKPIKKGAKIIRYIGPMLDCRKKKDDAVENKYLFQISKRWTIDGSDRKNVARYINHACKPNAESDVSKKKRRVVIRAIKAIAPGDEINYDYGEEYFKEYLKPIGCKCDACEKKRKKKRAKLREERLAKQALEARRAKAAAKRRAVAKQKVAATPGTGGAKRDALNGHAAQPQRRKLKTARTKAVAVEPAAAAIVFNGAGHAPDAASA